jgi:UDP-2,4-diacetamido-2,4,6-trideoxy-beta-L-altropyranose hydrolase
MILRPATSSDCDQYFEWANDPEVRANSFNQEPIQYDVHVRWFYRKLDFKNQMWVLTKSISNTTHFADTGCECECDHIPIGQIRLQQEQDHTEIHYSIAKEHRGQGNGRRMIQMALFEVKTWPVVAQVKQINRASRAIFDKLDFQIIATTSDSITYQKMQP